jgi:hypothetical protein
MTALVEVLIGDWYGERERRAAAESVIFAEVSATFQRAKGEGIPSFRRGSCRLTGGIALCLCGGQNSPEADAREAVGACTSVIPDP